MTMIAQWLLLTVDMEKYMFLLAPHLFVLMWQCLLEAFSAK
jgi:hypothetical protein